MEDESTAYQLYVGIDVAADTFTAAWLGPPPPGPRPCRGTGGVCAERLLPEGLTPNTVSG